jgi:4-carboxymuconolactone decarboxylase
MNRSVHIPLAAALMSVAVFFAAEAPAQSAPQSITQAPAQTRAQSLFGDVNPKLAQRDRSLVTVSALITMNRPDQLRSHLQRARANGLTEVELIEAITHLAFYTGWPNAVQASIVAKEVFQVK